VRYRGKGEGGHGPPGSTAYAYSFILYRLYSVPALKVCSNMCCSLIELPNLNYAHGLIEALVLKPKDK